MNDIKDEYLKRIDYLNTEKQKLKEELNDLKYEGGEILTRKQIDEIENNVNHAVNKCERTKNKYERISKILVNAKTGIEHLAEKLDFFKLEGKPNLIVTDDSLVEVLAQSVEKIKLIYKMVKNDPSYKPEEIKQFIHLAYFRTYKTLTSTSPNLNLLLIDKSFPFPKP